MLDWFNTLGWEEQILWILSIVFTIVYFYQIVMTIAKPNLIRKRRHIFSNFFGIKNTAAFFCMFGWMSIACLYQGFELLISLIIGGISGLFLMVITSVLLFYTHKLKEGRLSPKQKKE